MTLCTSLFLHIQRHKSVHICTRMHTIHIFITIITQGSDITEESYLNV
jgi:hypothetical protein